jgi:predicted thioesterase
VDQITSGTHQRFIVNAEKFIAKAQEKAKSVS